MHKRIKILSISGWGRSGSTILGNILGQMQRFCHVGELHSIWENGLRRNRLCGCGVPFKQCAVWRDVLRRAFGDIDGIDVDAMLKLSASTFRNRYTAMFMLLPEMQSLIGAATRKYMAEFEKIYRAIQESTGSAVIIDSSKIPAHAFMLSRMSNIDLYLVHLIRDARAVSFSWQRQTMRADDSGTPMERMGTAASSMKWNAWNITLGLFRRTLRERYMRVR